MTSHAWTRERCEALDVADPLGQVRDRFVVVPGEIYLDGNSLGALPRTVPARLAEVAEREWGVSLARSWARRRLVRGPRASG